MDDADLINDLVDWLKPIVDGKPCGVDYGAVHDPAFMQVEAVVDSITEQSEWRDVAKQIALLMKKTKSISVLVWNVRASQYTEKIPAAGLAKNLFLLRYWIENFWDCLYPPIDQGSSEEAYLDRINALANLGSYKDIVLPLKKKVISLAIGTGNYTLDDLIVFNQGGSVEGLQPPVGLLPDEETAYNELSQWFAKALEQAQVIKALLREKTGEAFTEFDAHLIPVLQIGATLRSNEIKADSAAIASGTTGVQVQGSGSVVKVTQGVNSRDDVVKAIDLICEYYQYHEPSSPVPLLLGRARKLVKKDFRDILSELRLGSSGDIDHLFGRID